MLIGMLMLAERAAQLDLARATAVEAGRDPSALEYTRWGSIEMPAEWVDGFAAQGVTRIVVGAMAADRAEQFDEMSAFSERFGLAATLGWARRQRRRQHWALSARFHQAT
ncbi:hypothetical protein [Nocardia sp. NPDC005998]|uniref:hypothetical protein n=1 Tax=Nocardia sp. NPDC005998 TaxID=3156894 RepID=UPI0033AFDC02